MGNWQKLCLVMVLLLAFIGGCDWREKLKSKGLEAEPEKAAVLFELDGVLPQFKGHGGLFPAMGLSQYGFERLLRKASEDEQVAHIVLRLGPLSVSLGRAQEIAGAIGRAAVAGKPVVCHIDAAANITYWIAASSCPKIVVSPAGGVDALGFGLEAVFIKDLLSSLGIAADMMHVGKYKDAADSMTRDSMSPASKENSQALLDEMYRLFVEGIAAGRNFSVDKVGQLIDGGPYGAEESVALGLADRVASLAQQLEELHGSHPGGVLTDYGKKTQKSLSLKEVLRLLSGAGVEKSGAPEKIALVAAVGAIASGDGDDLLAGRDRVTDIRLIEALGEAARDQTVKAVVLRIDSPGGSAMASDNIWNAVHRLAEVKPVVASLGDIAASGGYYIASAATEVLASPATITGSIGVVGGKIVFEEALAKWGIKAESLTTSTRALMHSPFRKFNDAERAVVQKLMERSYRLFVDRVVTGRQLGREEVLAAAEGRVWTGSQALEKRLISATGSLFDAVVKARQLAAVSDDAPVEFYPAPKGVMEVLSDMFGAPDAGIVSFAEHLPGGRRSLALAALLERHRVLAMTPVVFEVR